MDGDVVFGVALQDEAAVVGVGDERNVGLVRSAGRGVQVQDEVVRERGGEDERSAFDGESDGGFDEAGDVVGVGGAERRRG